ncbi:septation ring formation regulator EzrA [Bacillus sp. A301a_S52]|nr:septation ring formation regulator EzrA [Bacillus sp. A301a_S52]
MFLYIVYTVILLFLVMIIYGAWARKRVYKEVDRLESEKLQLMNEPVREELARIKGLKMSGETEERFEQWREEWDNIITIQLPDMEEKLFDIEEMANKYRFQKAKRYIKFMDEELAAVKQQMKEMIGEVDELLHSEEKNREDIHAVKEQFDDTKKKLWVQKGTLGQAAPIIEARLNEVHEMFAHFDEQTNEGNYFQAREILLEMQSLLTLYFNYMDEIPQLLVKLEKDLPKQLEELEKGLEEMKADGYPLHHFSYEWQVNEMKRQLIATLPVVENLQLTDAEEPVQRIENEINDIYGKLEHEVLSRNFVEKELPELNERLTKLRQLFEELSAEIETIKLNYRLDEEHDRHQIKLEKDLKNLFSQFAVLEDAMEGKKQSFTTLRKMIQDFQEQIQATEDDITETTDNLNLLRSDERQAEQTIQDLKHTLTQSQKHLQRSNIPGVPESSMVRLEEAEKLLRSASDGLNQMPISMKEINHKVEQAKKQVDECVTELEKTIDYAQLSEKAIQYGNRYRSQNDHVNIKLLQAEDRFRNYLYEEALELAVEALEPIDPDVLEKIKEQENYQVTYS